MTSLSPQTTMMASIALPLRLSTRAHSQSSQLGAAKSSLTISAISASLSFGFESDCFPEARISGGLNKLAMSSAVAKDKSISGDSSMKSSFEKSSFEMRCFQVKLIDLYIVCEELIAIPL